MEKRKSGRHLRLTLVLAATVAGTALVGWGGLAAWNAYSVNAGNSVAAGTLAHNNDVSANCASVLGTVPTSSGPGWCSAFISVTGVDPVNFTTIVPPAGYTIKIDNTGSLQSTFQLQMGTGAQAPTGSLCADLTLAVKDKNSNTVWTSAAIAAANFTATNLYNNAATPSYTWSPNGTAGTGTGATGDTFTFTVGMGAGFATDSTDAGASCSFGVVFAQTAA